MHFFPSRPTQALVLAPAFSIALHSPTIVIATTTLNRCDSSSASSSSSLTHIHHHVNQTHLQGPSYPPKSCDSIHHLTNSLIGIRRGFPIPTRGIHHRASTIGNHPHLARHSPAAPPKRRITRENTASSYPCLPTILSSHPTCASSPAFTTPT